MRRRGGGVYSQLGLLEEEEDGGFIWRGRPWLQVR